ncbi:MAG: hypothetical protein ABIK86_07625 [candidate division WOR-3 bacterium]
MALDVFRFCKDVVSDYASYEDIRQLVEYRTQRLVLEAWDRLFG